MNRLETDVIGFMLTDHQTFDLPAYNNDKDALHEEFLELLESGEIVEILVWIYDTDNDRELSCWIPIESWKEGPHG